MRVNAKVLVFVIVIMLIAVRGFCAEENKCQPIESLKTQITENKSPADITASFDGSRECFFRENKYNEFVDYLKSLLAQKKYPQASLKYYIALARFQQLACLEEKQLWDEYFNQGPVYREELGASLQEAIKATSAKDALNVYARLLLWEFYDSQEVASSMDALTGLMQAAGDYAKDALDMKPVKIVADKILAGGEKARAKELYKIYTSRITSADVKDEELKNIALGFYREGNLDLAESVYDAYVERLVKAGVKENLIAQLGEIAKAFSYNDAGANDSFYAEKIFEKIESACGRQAFNEELLYLRAYNLEIAKELKKARDVYLELITRYSDTVHLDEALFKIAMINVYGLRDTQAGREYFTKLSQRESTSPQVILALYHLGVLAQWEEDKDKAKEYYNKAIEAAGDRYKETIAFVQARLKEIENKQPIEYNLKTFLDTSLKAQNIRFNMTKLGLRAALFQPKTGQETAISSSSLPEASGCAQVVLEYYWSGNTGSTKPTISSAGFKTAYSEPGTKEVNLIVVSPPDIIDRDFIMVDVR